MGPQLKVEFNYLKVAKSNHSSFHFKGDAFQNSWHNLGYLGKKHCHQELSKIAQSGLTAGD